MCNNALTATILQDFQNLVGINDKFDLNIAIIKYLEDSNKTLQDIVLLEVKAKNECTPY